MSLVSELRRRNVFRMAVLYAVAAWLIMQVAEVVIDLAHLPDWLGPGTLGLLAIGLPISLIFSWFYELTPEGLRLEKEVEPADSITHVTGRRMDIIVISLLSAAVLLFAWHTWWPSTPVDKSIAVLAFENMSDDPEQEYFSDGISEDILNLLANVPELRVTSRASAFSFKGQNVDIPTIAAKLDVAHVLDGSVRYTGNQLRIIAQLVDVDTDSQIWSETYDREQSDIFAIQDEIAAAVVDELKITLLGKELKTIKTEPEAYALFLQGRYLFEQSTAASSKQAEALFMQVVTIDPNFAPAWTELGAVYERQAYYFALRPSDEGSEMARAAVRRALNIDSEYGRAYAILARVEMFYDWDFLAASKHIRQAQKLNPSDADVLLAAARLNTILARLDEAIDLYRQVTVLNPVWPTGHYRLGQALYYANRLDEATTAIRTALSLSPGMAHAQAWLGRVLFSKGDAPGALLALEQATEGPSRLAVTAIVQHVLGDRGASDAALNELISKYAAQWSHEVAMIYAFRGEIDHAFVWLEQAYNNRDTGLVFLLVNPWHANLHDDPRWEPFLDKMGLSH